jgi:hypothetical protein
MADKVESLTATYTPEVYARNLAALRNVVAYARSKDARIAFLMFPLRQEWMSYEPQHLHGHVTKALETVAQDAPIEVWDYRVWPRLETKHFSSYDHLNVYGARIFSREIDGRLYDPAPSMNP